MGRFHDNYFIDFSYRDKIRFLNKFLYSTLWQRQTLVMFHPFIFSRARRSKNAQKLYFDILWSRKFVTQPVCFLFFEKGRYESILSDRQRGEKYNSKQLENCRNSRKTIKMINIFNVNNFVFRKRSYWEGKLTRGMETANGKRKKERMNKN